MADQDRCPECGCEPGVTEQIDSESAAFIERTGGSCCPNCGRNLPPDLPDEVLDRAAEDIATGITGLWDHAWIDPDCRPGPDDVAHAVVEVVKADLAPVLIEHGRQQERARIRKLIEEHHLLTPQWQLAETRVFVHARRRWWHRFIPVPNRSQEVTMRAFLERYVALVKDGDE